MPHRDPRRNPALELAIPADSPGDSGTHRSARDPWEMLFGDGQWRSVQVVAWWRDKYGRWVVQVEYHVQGEGTHDEMYLADPERMREDEDDPPEWSPWA